MESRWKSPGEFFTAVVRAGTPGCRADERLYENRAASGMGEAVSSAGGFLLDSVIQNQVLQRAYANFPMIGLCRRFQVGPNSKGIKLNAVDETSRANGSRSGGVASEWTSEGGEITASKPAIRQMDIKLQKLTGLSYVSDELLEDAENAGIILIDAFSDELGFRIQDAIFNGDGVGKPLGIMQSPALITQAAEAGQGASTVIFENVQKMWMRTPTQCRKTAVWFINSDIEQQLFSMHLSVGTAGIPVWLPAGGASVAGYSTLFGRPVIPIEQCSTLGTTGDIVLADMNQYGIVERAGLKMDQSMHVRFSYHEQAFRFIYRIGGQPLWSAPLTPANGVITQSPFIALASR